MKTLYIIRGLPGSGKSTLAKSIVGDDYVEADMYHYKSINGNVVYDWKPENIHKSHKWCFRKVVEMMESNKEKIAVSNTFTRYKEFKGYIKLAKEFGYQYHVITVENHHSGKNIHNVPEKTIGVMENRYEIKLRNKITKVNG